MHHVPDQVVVGSPITSTPAHGGMVAPFVHDLGAKSAIGVLGPNRHVETATWAGDRDVRLERIQEGKKPRTCSRDAVDAEVRYPMAFVRRRIKQAMTNLGLDLGRQTLLGRSAGRAVITRTGKKRSPQERTRRPNA